MKTGILIASAAAFAAIGGAVATTGTGGDDGSATAPTAQESVQQAQDGTGFFDQDAEQDSDAFFSQDQGSGAPMMQSGGS